MIPLFSCFISKRIYAVTLNTSTIYDLLAKRAAASPDAVAVAAPFRLPISYERLRAQVEEVMAFLRERNIGRGDRIAIVLRDGPEMAVTELAVASCASSAPLNPGYRQNEFDFYLSDLNARGLIVEAGSESPAITVAKDRGLPVIRLSPRLSEEAGTFQLSCDIALSKQGGSWAEPQDEALVLHTSGTTGRPKIVPLTQMNLCTSATNIQGALGLRPSDRCLNVMPLFHVHGLVGALLSTLVAGGSIVCTPGFHAAHFFDWMQEFEPTWFTAVPTMHQSLLAYLQNQPRAINRDSLRFIRSCSSALPPTVMAKLEEVFGVPVVEAYGMTEASHQITINPLPPKRRKPGSVGVAVGQEVGIMDEAGRLLPPQSAGEVVIRGPNVMRLPDDRTARASAEAGGWLRTGDVGFLDGDGYLYLQGRIREMINRGGEKLAPREVEEVILRHPAVEQAVAFAVVDEKLGQEIAAAVVLRPDRAATECELQEFVASQLADFKVPRRVLFLSEIPKAATGKVQRTGLAEKLGLRNVRTRASQSPATRIGPRTETERKLCEIWCQILGVKDVSIHDNFFFDLNGDSLRAAELLVRVEQVMGTRCTGACMLQRPTVASMAEWIVAPPAPCHLVPLQPLGRRPIFFCVHGLTGEVFEFRHLAECFAPDRAVYGLRFDIQEGKPPAFSVKEMAARYVREIRNVQPEGPYVLAGHSSGGTIAFEVARQLNTEEQIVALLVLFDSVYPRYLQSLPSRSLSQRIPFHLKALTQMHFKGGATYIGHRLATLQDRLARKIWQTRFDSRVTSGPNTRDALANLRGMLTAAVESYSPEPYFGRVILFRSAERRAQADFEWDLGWSRSVPGGVEVAEVPGNHFSMLKEPEVLALVERLKACLADGRETQAERTMATAVV